MTAILITGASNGIGAALAKAYAAPGVTLYLCGRNQARLEDVAGQCRTAGAIVDARLMDITDASLVRSWIEEIDTHEALDIVVANAGVSGGSEEAASRTIFDVNVMGVLNTVHPAMDLMRKRKRGQIGIVSSIAGNRGLPSAPAYSASKVAVLAYAEAWRGRLAREGVGVSAICPGFVRSAITDQNDFAMPFFMEADQAARLIQSGLEKNQAKISFPWQMRCVGWLMRTLPSAVFCRLMAKLPNKS